MSDPFVEASLEKISARYGSVQELATAVKCDELTVTRALERGASAHERLVDALAEIGVPLKCGRVQVRPFARTGNAVSAPVSVATVPEHELRGTRTGLDTLELRGIAMAAVGLCRLAERTAHVYLSRNDAGELSLLISTRPDVQDCTKARDARAAVVRPGLRVDAVVQQMRTYLGGAL